MAALSRVGEIGATPLLSALFRDEPTVESLGLMGLEASAVGNHEFDRGAVDLLRLQQGGCHIEGCKGPAPFKGAKFQYLAASTVDERSGRTLLPPFHVKRFQGIPVAFIGLTLQATPTIVVPAGVAAPVSVLTVPFARNDRGPLVGAGERAAQHQVPDVPEGAGEATQANGHRQFDHGLPNSLITRHRHRCWRSQHSTDSQRFHDRTSPWTREIVTDSYEYRRFPLLPAG